VPNDSKNRRQKSGGDAITADGPSALTESASGGAAATGLAQSPRGRLAQSKQGVTTVGRSHARHAGVLASHGNDELPLPSRGRRWQAAHRTIPGETDKVVAAELRRQGLTPIYVGVEAKKSFEFKNPFSRPRQRRDVLLFTQRAIDAAQRRHPARPSASITSELTERASSRSSYKTSSESSRAVNRWPTASPASPSTFGTLH
jgi:hypothetical protein